MACRWSGRYPLADQALAVVVFAALKHSWPIVSSADLLIHLHGVQMISCRGVVGHSHQMIPESTRGTKLKAIPILLVTETIDKSIIHAVLLSIPHSLQASSLIVLRKVALIDQVLAKTETPATNLLFVGMLLPSINHSGYLNRDVEAPRDMIQQFCDVCMQKGLLNKEDVVTRHDIAGQ
jgi:hypothetical protein